MDAIAITTAEGAIAPVIVHNFFMSTIIPRNLGREMRRVQRKASANAADPNGLMNFYRLGVRTVAPSARTDFVRP